MKIRPIVWLNAGLAVPAVMSVRAGVRRGLERGQDLQWSGAHLAAAHIDPYRQFLTGDREHRILLAQVPNYLQELYVLLLPMGVLRFETARAVWTVLNLLFLVWILRLLKSMYALGWAETTLAGLLVLASTPFRIVLGNGQQSLLELLLFCLVFSARAPVGRGLALGLSYAKYSFSPVLFFYLAMRRQFRLLLLSAVPVLAGLLGLWALVGGRLVVLGLEPLEVSRTGVTSGLGDLMSVVEAGTAGRFSAGTMHALMYGAALVGSAGCALLVARRTRAESSEGKARGAAAAMLAVASLMLLTHLTYDYVFLAVPLAAGLRTGADRAYRAAAWVVGLLWLGLMFSGRVPDARIPVLQVSVFGVLLGLFLLLVLAPEGTRKAAGAAEGV